MSVSRSRLLNLILYCAVLQPFPYLRCSYSRFQSPGSSRLTHRKSFAPHRPRQGLSSYVHECSFYNRVRLVKLCVYMSSAIMSLRGTSYMSVLDCTWPPATFKGSATSHSFFTPCQRAWDRVGNRVQKRTWDIHGVCPSPYE